MRMKVIYHISSGESQNTAIKQKLAENNEEGSFRCSFLQPPISVPESDTREVGVKEKRHNYCGRSMISNT
ncbi:hypothetical protein IRJ41_004850 [Triplophysa rosa]|uniref:Uncharacterized protein n=1 Tax=Triplophysa rosa TaxID=992332 RepID=A0A9W7TVE9_TRIRA|nr:hypothetical protein IRJ41_004850 [Triplophysa rosa]